jgi:hypothetical protein
MGELQDWAKILSYISLLKSKALKERALVVGLA